MRIHVARLFREDTDERLKIREITLGEHKYRVFGGILDTQYTYLTLNSRHNKSEGIELGGR